jgi:hypothetical protein
VNVARITHASVRARKFYLLATVKFLMELHEQAKRAATAFQALPASRVSRDPREFRETWARAAA